MKILAIEKPSTSPPSSIPSALLHSEAARVWELYRTGSVREASFTITDHRAVLVLECDSESDAMQLLETLPLVREHHIAFDVLALRPYDGFERLFQLLPTQR